ncbi:MAG: hypothetical protein R3C24_11015 [Cyanobacteriota/Melainabacteria group bacterium]
MGGRLKRWTAGLAGALFERAAADARKGIGSQFGAAQYSARTWCSEVRFNVAVELDTIDWLLEKGPDGTLKIIEERQTVSVVKP